MAISHADGMLAVLEEETFQLWLKQQENRRFGDIAVGKRTLLPDGKYAMDELIEIAGVDVQFIHAPGHRKAIRYRILKGTVCLHWGY